jgi:hypothetical protein
MSHSRPMSRRQQWWIRIRHTAWFQWAHAPLCKRFEHDIWRVGPWHLCRSCTLLYGAGLAAMIGALASPLDTQALIGLTAAVLGPATLLSCPAIYRKFSRGWRDPIRAGMGAGLGLWSALAVSGGHWVALATFPILVMIYTLYRSQRQRLKRHMCEGCGELEAEGICSGYAQQAQSIRLYQIQIEDALNCGTGPPPGVKPPIANAV